MSAIRISRAIRSTAWWRLLAALKARALRYWHRRISTPPISKSPHLMSATRRRTLIPGEARAVFQRCASNDIWDARNTHRRDRPAAARGGGQRGHLPARSGADQRDRLPDTAGRLHRLRAGCDRGADRHPPRKLSTTGGTSDARFIKSYCPVVEFGPRRPDHAQGERACRDRDLEGTGGDLSRDPDCAISRSRRKARGEGTDNGARGTQAGLESWRDAVARRKCGEAGCAEACLEAFEAYRIAGDSEFIAAYRAMEKFDCLDRVSLPGDPEATPRRGRERPDRGLPAPEMRPLILFWWKGGFPGDCRPLPAAASRAIQDAHADSAS